ncbi:MAG: hypothetical protein ACOYOK_11605 [Pseudobdellovibrionaceae bacterium]
MFLYDITDALQKEKIPFCIVGGYAMALHGMVRATMDVDLVLSLKLEIFEKAESCFKSLGLTSRIPVRAQDIIKMRKEYIQNRNLVAWSFVDFKNPSRQLDILITKDIKDLKWQTIPLAGRKIPVVGLESLLKMKLESGRPQDLLDIENIRIKLSGAQKK